MLENFVAVVAPETRGTVLFSETLRTKVVMSGVLVPRRLIFGVWRRIFAPEEKGRVIKKRVFVGVGGDTNQQRRYQHH